MPIANLGRIGFVNKGAYVGGTTVHKVNDIVKFNNSVYVCIQAHSVEHLPTDVLYWEIWVDTTNYYVRSEVDGLIQTDVGAPIASATTTNVGGLTAGDVIHITGVTTITSLGVSATGTIRRLVFDGILTMTHNGTSLILPGASDILTAAGSIGEFVCENGALGYWRCTNFTHSGVSVAEMLYTSTLVSDAQTQLNSKVAKDSATGVAYYPAGTTAERPVLADTVVGVRYNTTLGAEEVGIGTAGATTWKVLSDTSHTHAIYLALAGGTMTGAITALRETKVAMGANDIDLVAGNLFTKTISVATTLTVSGWLASGNANSFVLELTNGGSAAITWFSGVKWASGVAPTLTAAGVDILGFYSHDGGTTVRGILLAKDSK